MTETEATPRLLKAIDRAEKWMGNSKMAGSVEVIDDLVDGACALLARVDQLEQALGELVVLLLQNDFETAHEIALGIKVEFPDGSPRATLRDEKGE